MNDGALEIELSESVLQRTRTIVFVAGACGAGVVLTIGLAVVAESANPLFLTPLLWVGQLVLGIVGFVVGRRAAKRISVLRLPAAVAEAKALGGWAGVSLAIAILGIAGAMLAFAVGALFIIAAGAVAGAWGRPLRVRGKTVGATLGDGHGWARGPRPHVENLDDTTRRALGHMWLHDAIKEHGSVPAFAQLSWNLAALGAPVELLQRCNRSALQEIDHAQRCFAVTETYFDQPIGVGPIPAATAGLPGIRSRLGCAKRVALETLEDGCLIEDLNADFAQRAHALARDPAMRSLTACIAAEEREHADLAWDILAFCIRLHPSVARAVARKLDRLPDHVLIPYRVAVLEVIARADEEALAAHGRVPFAEWPDIYARRWALTIARAEALLQELAVSEGPGVPAAAGS